MSYLWLWQWMRSAIADHFIDFFYWLSILLTSILATVVGTLVPSIFKQATKPRNHHNVRLVDECIARHQFAYVPYFITLGLIGHFGKWEPLRPFISVLLVWVIFSYIISVNLNGRHEKLFKDKHGCEDSNPTCDKEVSKEDFKVFFGSNIRFAKILAILGLLFAAVVKR